AGVSVPAAGPFGCVLCMVDRFVEGSVRYGFEKVMRRVHDGFRAMAELVGEGTPHSCMLLASLRYIESVIQQVSMQRVGESHRPPSGLLQNALLQSLLEPR